MQVRIHKDAKTGDAEYKGAPVKESFYTAGRLDGSPNRYLRPMNHTETLVFDREFFRRERDVMLRTGNGLAKIIPEAYEITDASDEGDFRVYEAEPLPEGDRLEILGLFGIQSNYDSFSSHAARNLAASHLVELANLLTDAQKKE